MGKATFRETFKSPFYKDSYEEAMEVLNQIRKTHSIENGWTEIDAYVEKMANGKYRAVRIHQKNL